MEAIRIIAQLEHISGLPKDRTNNVFHFMPDALDDTNANLLLDAVENFYNVIATGAVNSLSEYLSTELSRVAGAHVLKYIELPDTGPPTPIPSPRIERNFDISGAADAQNLPGEVAFKVSFHADTTGVPEHSGATRPKARRRGGVFLGSLNRATLGQTSGNAAQRPAAVLIDDARRAALDLINTSSGITPLAVMSITDWTAREVVGGWVDNAFDTIRKRGVDPTVRTLITP